MYLDAIVMRLQTIGENVKKISKLQDYFFLNDLQYDVINIIRFRDLISHHYEKLDSDITFEIRRDEIPVLKEKINTFLREHTKK